MYNGPAPILSVGYVAGYASRSLGRRTAKHVIVNGAFNPGNSGGPVFKQNDDKVIAVVVWKALILPGWVPSAIQAFEHPRGAQVIGNFELTLPDGTKRTLSDEEATGIILEQFYDSVQVMIGEATSVSELREFINIKTRDLSSPGSETR